MIDKTRCFIALDLPQEAIDEIKRIQYAIKENTYFKGKFTEPKNLHLTLKFLGEIDTDKINAVKQQLKEIQLKPFEAELGEVSVFSKRHIRIIWIKLEGKVVELQKKVDEALVGLFKPEQRFMSHITIARVKSINDNRALLDYLQNLSCKEIKFNVDRFLLKQSELFPEGPVYKDIEEYKL